jgi:hypothetical protein
MHTATAYVLLVAAAACLCADVIAGLLLLLLLRTVRVLQLALPGQQALVHCWLCRAVTPGVQLFQLSINCSSCSTLNTVTRAFPAPYKH